MKNVIWTKQYKVAINGKPNWSKGINDVVISQMSTGVYCAGVLYYDENTQNKGEAFFRLEQFVGADPDNVWEEMDAWVNTFTEGMGGYEYIPK